jgi:AcrR family transcriptional regulator
MYQQMLGLTSPAPWRLIATSQQDEVYMPKNGETVQPAERIAAGRPSRRSQKDRSEQTRAKLIQTGVAMIAEGDLSSLTTAELALRAGVTRGALQHHFASRADLLIAVLDEMMRQINLLTPLSALRGLPLAERIDALCKHYLAAFRNPIYAALVGIWLGELRQTLVNSSLQQRANALQEELDRLWLEAFDDLEIPEEKLLIARRIVADCLRGRAILEALGVSQDYSSEMQRIRALMLSLLRD